MVHLVNLANSADQERTPAQLRIMKPITFRQGWKTTAPERRKQGGSYAKLGSDRKGAPLEILKLKDFQSVVHPK